VPVQFLFFIFFSKSGCNGNGHTDVFTLIFLLFLGIGFEKCN